MTTLATDELRQLAADWKALWGSAKVSGIVGNTEHALRGGYHISREDQTNPENYSIVRPDDKVGPSNTASAIDMTMNTADMIACTKRLVVAFNNLTDPRRKYINGFNGTIDGKTAHRWDVYAHFLGAATADHLWHVHLSIRRRYCNSPTAMKAILSILKGESVEAYLRSVGVVPASRAASDRVPPVAPVKAPPYPGRVLRRNDRQVKPDAAVKAFQAQMRRRGWSSIGEPDGFFGPKLEAVVKRWQAVAKVPADGVIGPKTWPTPWTRRLGG